MSGAGEGPRKRREPREDRLNRTVKIARAASAAACLALFLAAPPRPALAVAVSPRVVAAARGTPEEAALQERIARYERARALGVDQPRPEFTLNMAKFPRDGVAHRNILVVLAEFDADSYGPALHHAPQSTPEYYQQLLFSDDPTDGITSLREYYRENSHGRLLISGRVTPAWLTMPHSAAYYTNQTSGLDFTAYPRSAQKLAEDAMQAAYAELGNLSFFDNDGPDGVPSSGDDDGYIDAVMVIHPGQGGEILTGTASANALWSHEFGIATYTNCPVGSAGPDCLPGLILGGVRGFLYVLAPEYNDYPGDHSCGTYFHEFGHTLGLADLYDPNAAGLGFYSLMGVGNYLPISTCNPVTDHNCPALGSHPGNLDAWSRQYLGFETPVIPTGPGPISLGPTMSGGGVLKLWKNGQPGTEYFLVENRLQQGSDLYLPGQGLLVYHVDDTQQDNLGGPSTYRVRVVAADGRNDLETSAGNYGDSSDFFPGSGGVRDLTNTTTPNTLDYANQDTGVRLTNIHAIVPDGQTNGTFDLALSTAPDIHLASYRIGDGGGNGNGYADNGETDSLYVSVANLGVPSGALTLTLTTADAGVTVTQPAGTALAASTGQTVSVSPAFVFQVGTYATLPHDVPFSLGWTDGTTTGTAAFTVTVGMRAGLTEDFESGLGAWTTGPLAPSTVDEWHASDVRAHGGSGSAKCGSTNALGTGTNEQQTYAPLEDAVLTSPFFDLPRNSQLVFYSWIDAETNGGTGAWDGGRVEIARADGVWRPLDVDGGYPYQIETSAGDALRGSSAFSGSPNHWRRVVADLSAYSGPVQVRFRFASDGANQPTDQFGSLVRIYEGWYVDDVSVQPRVDPGPTPIHVTLRAGPSPYQLGAPSAGAIHIRLTAADGLPHPGTAPKVRVFDLKGRLVRTLTAFPNGLAPAQFETTWDARTEEGVKVSAGLYFLQSDIQGHTESTKLVILK